MGSDTRNITLLRGIVSIDRHVNGARTGWRDVGEVPTFEMPATDLSNIDVVTARDYTNSLLKRIATKKTPKVSIKGLEINDRNVALQVLGFSELLEQEAGTGTDVPLADAMEFGVAYDLGFENVSAVTIAGLVEDTDFVVDAAYGTVTFLDTGDGVEGDPYTASFTYGLATSTVISIAGSSSVNCSILYRGKKREDDDFDIWYDAKIWHVQLQPSDVLSLITAPGATEPAGWGFSADVLSDTIGAFGGSPRYPYGQLFPRRNEVGS